MLNMIRMTLVVASVLIAEASAAPPNKLPTVTLTAPASGATFTAPATITLAANAADSDGTVVRVEFYQGGTLLGTRTSAPYSWTWGNVAAGSYALTAKAIDNNGGIRTSSAVSVTVSGPKLLIASPANGAVVYGGSVTVSGSFSGDANTTVFVDNGNTTRLATLTANAYSATIPLYVGANSLRVIATRRDKTSDQSSVNVVGNANPIVVFTAPSTTTFDPPADILLAADAMSPAANIAKVEFLRNGVLLGASHSPPYQNVWSGATAGSYNISAVATDTNGVSGSVSLPITVNGANATPVVNLTSPSNGASFVAPAQVSLAATASDSDGSISRVEFLQNGNVIGSTNVPPYAMTWSNVAAGTYALTARATDNRSGTGTSALVNITVSSPNAPPTVTIVSPASGATYVAPASIVLTASAADDGAVARVDFHHGPTLIGSALTSPYTVTWSNVSAGSYNVTAKATDNAGAISTSSPILINVGTNNAPTVAIATPSSGAAYDAPATIAFSASATDSDGSVARVEYFNGATPIGASTAPPYTFDWTGVPAGSYSITAHAMDNAGAVATSAPVQVTVNAATFAIVSPTDSSTVNNNYVNVRGTVQAAPNSGIEVNGVVAAIDASGHFYANGVPIKLGSNTLMATLTTPIGQTSERSITVSSTGPGPFKVAASPGEGLSPLTVIWDIGAQSDVAIQKVELDIDGNGSFDQTMTSDPFAFEVTYTGVGTVMAAVRVTDVQGGVYTEVTPIVIADAAALDQTLRAVWNGMKSALSAGDKPSAMRYLDPSMQLKYGSVIDVLLPNMAQIVGSFSDLRFVSVSSGLGEYAINRTINGENRLFFVYFSRNADGVWRVGSF